MRGFPSARAGGDIEPSLAAGYLPGDRADAPVGPVSLSRRDCDTGSSYCQLRKLGVTQVPLRQATAGATTRLLSWALTYGSGRCSLVVAPRELASRVHTLPPRGEAMMMLALGGRCVQASSPRSLWRFLCVRLPLRKPQLDDVEIEAAGDAVHSRPIEG